MPRAFPILVLALIIAIPGCRGKPDPVLATFVNDEFATNRIVFYASGKYELYAANDDGSLQRRPYVTGSYLGSASNYVVSVKAQDLPSPDWPVCRVYRIIRHDGLEYLFDERGNAARKYAENKDVRELRHAWRREGD